MYSVLNSFYNFFMVVNFIAHMVHSLPIHNDCFVNKDFIIIIIIVIIIIIIIIIISVKPPKFCGIAQENGWYWLNN